MVEIIPAAPKWLGVAMSGISLLLASALISACSPGPPAETSSLLEATREGEASATATPSPARLVIVTPEVYPTPWATLSALGDATPEPTSEPTSMVTSTPSATFTPAATSTPMASAQLPELARSLDDKVAPLAAALAARNVDQALRLQKEALDEADRVESALKADHSTQADLVRQAIRDLRGGATGNLDKLGSVRDKLRVASGGSGDAGQAAGQDLQKMAASLQSKLNSFNDARQQNQVDTALRLQQELLQEVTRDQKTVDNLHSDSADRFRGALEDLKSGLAGDDSKLGSAANSLQTLSAAASSSGSSPSASSTQLRESASSLDSKISVLQEALSSGSTGQLLQAQRDLLDELARVETAIKGDGSDQASRLRDAVSLARDGASGDTAKLDAARARLAGSSGTAASGAVRGSQSPSPASPSDLPRMADELSRKVDSYKAALDQGSRTDLLRLQQDLMEQLSQDEQKVSGVPGPEAEQMHSAFSDLRNALSGDLSKLNSANASLRLVAAGPQAPASSPPSQQSGARQQSSQQVQAAARDLLSTVSDAEAALKSGSAEDMAQVQSELQQRQQEIQKLSPNDAAALNSAVGAIREALGGDHAKLDQARSRLEQIIPR